jgi:hypothetical protein
VLGALLLTACASPNPTSNPVRPSAPTAAATVTSLPGFDMTVPAAWHIVGLADPYGTKFMSNAVLQDPCATADNGADCSARPLVDTLGADQVVLTFDLCCAGPPRLFMTSPGQPLEVDHHPAVWRLVSPEFVCVGTKRVGESAQIDIRLGDEYRWLRIGACMGTGHVRRLSAEIKRAVLSIRFDATSMTGPPGPGSFRGTVDIS